MLAQSGSAFVLHDARTAKSGEWLWSKDVGTHGRCEVRMWVWRKEQHAPLPWFLGLSLKASDWPPPMVAPPTHTQIKFHFAQLCLMCWRLLCRWSFLISAC
jgi:hypothetical protein